MSGASRTLKINIVGDAKDAEQAFASVEQSADGMGKKLATASKVGMAAVVGLGAAAAGLGVAAFKMGETFDGAFDAIAIGTGATGDALAQLEDDFKSVVSNVPTDFDTAAGAITNLNTLTGATGETLQGLTENVLNASRMLGEDGVANSEAFGRAMTQWNTPAEEGAELLDDLFRMTQDYGVGLNKLIGDLNTYGPVMKNAGFSTEETAELMARLSAEGIAWSRISPGLNASFRRWAEAGKEPREELGRVIEAMQNAETDVEALNLATEAFGAEGAQRMTTAIRNGTFTLDDLGEILGDNAGLINDLAGETDDLGQKWQLLKNRAMVAFEPIASGVFNMANAFMDQLLPAAERVFPVIVSSLEGIASAFQEGGIGEAISEVGSLIARGFAAIPWGSIAGAMLSGLMSALRAASDLTADLASWLWDTFTNIDWTATGGAVVNGLLAGIGAVVDAGSRILGWLSGQLTSVDWTGLGLTIVNGLLTGVTAVADAGQRLLGWLSGQLTSVDWTGLGQTVVNGVLAGITAVQDFGSRFVSWFQSGLQGGDWSGIGQTISSQISGALQGLSDLGPVQSLVDLFNTRLLPVLQTVAGEISSRVTPTLQMFRDSLGQVSSNISTNLGPTLDRLRELWVSLQPAINALLPVLQAVATLVAGALLASFNGLVGLLSGVLPNAVNAAFAVLNGLITILTGLVETVTGVVQVVKGLLTGDWALAWEGAKQVVSGMVTAVTGLFEGLWGAIKGFVQAVVDGVIGLFQGLYNTLVGNSIIPDMINGIIEWFTKLPGEIIGIISGFVTSAIGFFADLAADGAAKAGELITGILSELGRLMGEAITKVSEFVHSALGFLADLVSDGATKAGEFLTGVMTELNNLLTQGPAEILKFVTAGVKEIAKLATDGATEAAKLPGAVLEAVGDLSETLVNAGTQVVQGFIDGMGSMIESVGEKAGDIVGTVTGQITSGFGIFSPSRVMYAYGRNIDEGLIEGIESKIADVVSAAQELSAAILEGATRDLERVPELAARVTDDVALALADKREELEGQLDLAILRGDDEETIQGYRDQLAVIEALLVEWSERTGQTVYGVFEGIAAQAAAVMSQDEADRIAAEWDQRLSDALSGPAFGEGLQQSIDELQTKIDLGPLMGVPQHVIDGWETEKADLQQQATNFWWDVANAAAAGLIDPETLKLYADAGGEQFAAYLETLAGPEAVAALSDSVEVMSKEAVDELKAIFAEAPEIAGQFVDDIVKGMEDGSIAVEDAAELLAMIPQEEIVPALEEMSDTYQEQIVQAIIDGNYDLVASLKETKGWVDEMAGSLDSAAEAAESYTDKMNKVSGPVLPSGMGGTTLGGAVGGIGNRPDLNDGQWSDYFASEAERDAWLAENRRRAGEKAANEKAFASNGGVPGRSVTVVNNVHIDGEPVAESVNKVNERQLATMMGPV